MKPLLTIILAVMLCGCSQRKEDSKRIADLERTVGLMGVWISEASETVATQQKSIDALFECIKAQQKTAENQQDAILKQQDFNATCMDMLGLLKSNALHELKPRPYLTQKPK
jgi:thiamine biosynthesis lipoprotein ApbE